MIKAGTGNDHKAEGNSQEAASKPSATQYFTGPGFELAVRSVLGKSVQISVAHEGGPPRKAPRSADEDHRHELLEQRLDSIERALFIIVDQLKRIDDHIARIETRPAK